MRIRGSLRALAAFVFLMALTSAGGSCYRAEIDLSPLLDDQVPASGGGLMSGAAGEAGQAASGAAGEGATGGGAGAPACEIVVDDPVQYQCRLRPPSKEVCDTQDSPGWAGCYNGGCAICQEVLLDYPSYLARHPCCSVNTTCGVHAPLKCSPLCPPPTELDKLEPCFDLER